MASRESTYNAEYMREWRSRNPDYQKKWWKEKGTARRYHAKRYGLTADEYNALLAQPCGICGGEAKVVDHDHVTGRNRGALCASCNMGLGQFGDDADRLIAAALYLIQKGGE